ncbi:DUF3168 domain-containing protein [Crenobacter cavernae]|uniref:DUF3168 domain-containing protein n=1 Tax=Crenobacter cavernae TaxID=2290923 RepID=A0ABY0FAN3_9NEIS|nr:DUF3168 domain-containing protein [Crenobacter cavernae]RXZ42709.1 DUF3168 domain-containing protein [Crenobacter cavernae]
MIEPTLVATFGPLVGGRVFADFAPAGTPLPFATYQQVGGRPVSFLEGAPASKKHARFQINVWSTSRQEAMTIIRLIEDLAVQVPLLGEIEGGAVALYDEAADRRGAMQDFSFWFDA